VPFPRFVARANRYVANPITRTFAGRVKPFAIVVHRGRTSGREYRTPVNAFETEDGYVIALTYGSESDWVRNVQAAGRAELVVRGQTVMVTEPTLIPEENGIQCVAKGVRPILRALNVTEFLRLRR
jgi:deazaflavin-dependent oxidoreductase (nitroreductase family)